MKNLKVFETKLEYNSYMAGEPILPNVSYCLDEEIVEYNPYVRDYSKEYLTFEALEDTVFTMKTEHGAGGATITKSDITSISYSTDNGRTWNTYNTPDNGINSDITLFTTPTIHAGEKVLWKGIGTTFFVTYYRVCKFTSTGSFKIYGNIMSLLYGDNFENKTSFSNNTSYNFGDLFSGISKLTDASKLILPATTLATDCYYLMFKDCTSLTIAPELPATTLANECYSNMFNGCTGLIAAPELPATTLADYCYHSMFYGCTSLTEAPELPVTTLAEECYNGMFRQCTSLVTAPILPAVELATRCYRSMFLGCSNLNYIKALFTTEPNNNYTEDWVLGVAASGTFVKNSEAEWNTTGTNGIPSGWTVQTASA